ncbi:signal recognition particle-docking protein FtsY [Candidatus Woesearchaeota archaeon]|nr:signal recognition particle-docking protein FtsY [Candidatus Woesearchaeota archaeon]
MEEVPVEKIEKQLEQEKSEKEKEEKAEEEKKKAEKKVKEDLEKGEIPSIQSLTERKKQVKEDIQESEIFPEPGLSEKQEPPEEQEKEEKPEEKKEEIRQGTEEIKEDTEESEEKKPSNESREGLEKTKGLFSKFREKIVTKKITESQFDSLFWDLELALLENNVAVEVIEKIKQNLKENLVDKPIKRSEISSIVTETLSDTIRGLFDVEQFDIVKKAKEKKPLVICFVGINGSGKTTTIAKVAKLLQDNGLSCVLAASDTFRAAAIDQLQQHADRLGLKLIKHDYGSDAAAVAYDAISHARSKDIDVVLIDTAGRIHSNVNLMDEMKKIIKVADPDLKIFVGESITGNDCTEQAKKFNETIGIDGIILSKADIDEKGGAAISVSHVTGKPILYLGDGQEYSDLKKFDPGIIVESLGL